MLKYSWIVVELLLISSLIIDKNWTKSIIIVVEDQSKDCVGHHGNKNGEGQDPSLCKRFTFWLTKDNLAASLAYFYAMEGEWMNLWFQGFSNWSFCSISLQQQPDSPSLPCWHQQLPFCPYPGPFWKHGRVWSMLFIWIIMNDYEWQFYQSQQT